MTYYHEAKTPSLIIIQLLKWSIKKYYTAKFLHTLFYKNGMLFDLSKILKTSESKIDWSPIYSWYNCIRIKIEYIIKY